MPMLPPFRKHNSSNIRIVFILDSERARRYSQNNIEVHEEAHDPDNMIKFRLYARANNVRCRQEFDSAYGYYAKIIKDQKLKVI